MIDTSSGDLPITARLSASLFNDLGDSTAFSSIVISRDVAIIEPTIRAHIHWMLSFLADQLLSSSAPSAFVVLRARAIIAPTILEHTYLLSASLYGQQPQASTVLSTTAFSRDLAITVPTICPRIRRLPASLEDQLHASSACSMIIIPSDLPIIAPTILMHTCRQSTSLVAQQIQASTALSTIVIFKERITIFCGGSAPSIHSTKRSYAYASTVSFSGRPAAPNIYSTFNKCHFKTSSCHSADHSCTHFSTAVSFCGPAPSIINHD